MNTAFYMFGDIMGAWLLQSFFYGDNGFCAESVYDETINPGEDYTQFYYLPKYKHTDFNGLVRNGNPKDCNADILKEKGVDISTRKNIGYNTAPMPGPTPSAADLDAINADIVYPKSDSR